jgi:hypothetical protein
MTLKEPILMATITTLAVPLTYAAYYQFWHIYGTMLFMLMAGLAYHSSKDPLILRIDQAAILQFTYMCYVEGSQLGLLWLAAYAFGYTGVVYGYGYSMNRLAFSPSYLESRFYHGLIHLHISTIVSYGIYVKSLQH